MESVIVYMIFGDWVYQSNFVFHDNGHNSHYVAELTHQNFHVWLVNTYQVVLNQVIWANIQVVIKIEIENHLIYIWCISINIIGVLIFLFHGLNFCLNHLPINAVKHIIFVWYCLYIKQLQLLSLLIEVFFILKDNKRVFIIFTTPNKINVYCKIVEILFIFLTLYNIWFLNFVYLLSIFGQLWRGSGTFFNQIKNWADKLRCSPPQSFWIAKLKRFHLYIQTILISLILRSFHNLFWVDTSSLDPCLRRWVKFSYQVFK